MVERQQVDAAAGEREHLLVPVGPVAADGDEPDRRVDGAHRVAIPEVVAGVGRGIGIAAHPVAPDLVAQLPRLHVERLAVAVRRAHRAVLGVRRAVHVLDPRGSLVRRGAGALHVDDEVRLRADRPAERDELVAAEIARLALVPPRLVDPGRTPVARTDAPLPVVVLRDVAAGPADERRLQRLDALEHVGADAVDGIARHQRHLIEPEPALAVEQDRELGERIGLARRQREGVLVPGIVGRDLRDHL